MKYLIFSIVFMLMLFPFAVSSSQLPTSSWQVYGGGILIVYSGANSMTPVVYRGDPALYEGSATTHIPYTPIFTSSLYTITRWEAFSAGILTVHSNNNQNSSIIYSGPPQGYEENFYQSPL